ncbi:MAG TPA: hypothetical protein VFX39_08690 [Gemmatimonadaceae bacterium]|nr:hypothetical protein [Gemmatimonadaceae bacterium]
MRRVHLVTTAAAVAMITAGAGAAGAQDSTRSVAGGGIHVPGWQGKIDAREAASGSTVNDAKLVKQGDALHATTGPATSFWDPKNTATGDYTVRATFREPKYMALNDHPHPYGLFIGGSDLDTDKPKYLYCAAYGNGNFIVRGFGPEAFQLNGRRGEANDAVHKGKPGEPVTQEIALSVKGDRVECAINGTTVGSYPKSEVVQAGRLSSTDGVYGIRLGHNTEAVVTGLEVEKP